MSGMLKSRIGCVNVSGTSKYLTGATNSNEAPLIFEPTSGQDTVARLRTIVKSFVHHPKFRDAFMIWIKIGNENGLFVFQNKTVSIQPKPLLLDLPTRWESTKEMIKRCITMRLVSPCT